MRLSWSRKRSGVKCMCEEGFEGANRNIDMWWGVSDPESFMSSGGCTAVGVGLH